MKSFHFNLRLLVLIVPAILMVAVPAVHYFKEQSVFDVAVDQSAICEVHHQPMVQSLVEIKCGSRTDQPIDQVRSTLFPHAYEEFDTRSDCSSKQTKARVHVCNECSKARQQWVINNLLPENLQVSK